MTDANPEERKRKLRDFWNVQPCGSEFSNRPRTSKEYFEEIEDFRYFSEPEVFSFAQFTRFHGQRILEVGVGVGTDFVQWVRAGAKSYGVDISSQAIGHVRDRLALYRLEAEGIMLADVEDLPFRDGSFDLVYSWGVIHHTPDTWRALGEIIRVCRPGGICKIMVYNRHSLTAFYIWTKMALLRGRPWKSLSWCIGHFLENPGTRAFTQKEIRTRLSALRAENVQVRPLVTFWDRLGGSTRLFQVVGQALAALLAGFPVGWFLTVEFTKPSPTSASRRA